MPPVSATEFASTVVPSLKLTVPVGVPVAGETGATVAVIVNSCPKFEGFGLELTIVVVLAASIVSVTVIV
jgi:hypothetical protein